MAGQQTHRLRPRASGDLSLTLSLSLYIYIYICVSLSVSLSLSIYIYIYDAGQQAHRLRARASGRRAFGPSRCHDCSTLTSNITLREDLSTGYGLRFSTEVCGSEREKTVFHGSLQKTCFVTEISRKPPGVYGRM